MCAGWQKSILTVANKTGAMTGLCFLNGLFLAMAFNPSIKLCSYSSGICYVPAPQHLSNLIQGITIQDIGSVNRFCEVQRITSCFNITCILCFHARFKFYLMCQILQKTCIMNEVSFGFSQCLLAADYSIRIVVSSHTIFILVIQNLLVYLCSWESSIKYW